MKALSLISVLILSSTASALQVTPVKTLDPVDQNLSSTAFTSSENYVYQRLPQDNFSRIDVINIYSSATGALVVAPTVSRDFATRDVLVLEKLGKVVLSADDSQRPGEFGSIDVIDLKTGNRGPSVFSMGSNYVAVNEARKELYVRNPLFGKFTTFDLATGKSNEIAYHPNQESIIFAGGSLLKIAYEDKNKGIYNLVRMSDGKKLGTFDPSGAPLIENLSYTLMANRYLWIFKRSGKAFEGLFDLQDGTALLPANNSTILSGLSETSDTVAIVDTIHSTLSQFDVASGSISQIAQLNVGAMNFVTGFYILNPNKVRVSTYNKEIVDLTLNPPSGDSSGIVTCDGPLLSLSSQGNYALCAGGKQSSWFKVQ